MPGCDTCSTRSALARPEVKKSSFLSSWMKCWTGFAFSHVKLALYKSRCVRAFFYYLKHLHLFLFGLETLCLKSHTWSAPSMNKKEPQGLFVTSQDFYQSGDTQTRGSKCFENVSSPETNNEGVYRSAVEQKKLLFGTSACTFTTIWLSSAHLIRVWWLSKKSQWWWSLKWSSSSASARQTKQWWNSLPETKLAPMWDTSWTNCCLFILFVVAVVIFLVCLFTVDTGLL